MVVGGGISGIQAALDLATAGFKVYLVEKAPTIGGKMAQLDKTFPTNDCSMCIVSPKFVECRPASEYRDSDLYRSRQRGRRGRGLHGHPDQASPATLSRTNARAARPASSTARSQSPDPFNQELSDNKAIHIYFSQAIPLVPYIDESCLYLKEKKCRICEGVCKNNAIDLQQKAEKVRSRSGRSSCAPGYRAVRSPSARTNTATGRCKNVVTSLDFERLLCATGPHEGEILRPSDKKHPHKIAWIHCVGSRQVTPGRQQLLLRRCAAPTPRSR